MNKSDKVFAIYKPFWIIPFLLEKKNKNKGSSFHDTSVTPQIHPAVQIHREPNVQEECFISVIFKEENVLLMLTTCYDLGRYKYPNLKSK